jgi:hypothetical protein
MGVDQGRNEKPRFWLKPELVAQIEFTNLNGYLGDEHCCLDGLLWHFAANVR